MSKKSIAVIGGGPAALAFAAFVDTSLYVVTIYEKNKQFGRKFLVAGKGGFNLTHSEDLEVFINRYTPSKFLESALRSFTNNDFRAWLDSIGIPTFIGSSNRIYPKEGIKPIEVLEAIIKHLKTRGIHFEFEHEWIGWDEHNELKFANNKSVKSDKVVFALGGASWKVTGSTGNWLTMFHAKGIEVLPFQASNCAFQINWNPNFIAQHEGSPLKNCTAKCEDQIQKGEGVITKFGIEGNLIYALSPTIRKQLQLHGIATIYIDFKPTTSELNLLQKIKISKRKNTSDILKFDLKLTATQIALLKLSTSKEEYLKHDFLVKMIKQFPLLVTALASLEESISTVGGVSHNAISQYCEIETLPNHFCIGEMVDWDAPTGGYLLQACFSMGAFLAKSLD